MATSAAFFSSVLNIPNSKILNSNLGFPKTRLSVRKKQILSHLHSRNPIFIVDSSSSSSVHCNSAAITNSLTLDYGSINNEELIKAESKFGLKIRVKVPLKLYHVLKVPEYDLTGKTGVLKQYVGVYMGKRISANMSYKVEFVADETLGRDGKPVKFLAHLRLDEFEFVD